MKKDFKPHMMYDPKTGKGYEAKTYKDHLAMKKKGFLHKEEITEERVAKVAKGRSRRYNYG